MLDHQEQLSLQELSLNEVRLALGSRHFDIVDLQPRTQQLRVVGRVPEDKGMTDTWFFTVHGLLSRAAHAPWNVDVSKAYSLRDTDKKLLYVWRLIFQADNPIASHYRDIAQALRNAPRASRAEVTSFPLPGAHPNRYAGRVGYTGKVVVGRDLLRR